MIGQSSRSGRIDEVQFQNNWVFDEHFRKGENNAAKKVEIMGKSESVLASRCWRARMTPAQDVTTNAMPGADFSKYHTYKWVTIEGAVQPNQIVDAQIKQSIDSQLAAKGLTKTDGDKADLLIGYQISIDPEKQWNAYGTGGCAGAAEWPQPTIHDQHRHTGPRYV